ncbi:probable clathrin assembly protein At4g32285 [Neltuma alba]|uniref:probable clathrin assembly protein At4g32285 n=1 Tax=Neltuma alba TaxID=207710 RepID=UPI0010A3CE94|nr:probable clathrin assembly protein At4g32285 [Prosopis alba]
MAPGTIRKAIGVVKDQTSIGIAKVASNMAPELEVAIVKATSHVDDPASEKYVREILSLISYSQGYVHACVSSVSKRLAKTRDWIVALKVLMLLHRLMKEGPPLFHEEILYATRRGTRLLNMSDFRDEARSSSWDHSTFVRTYAMYLDQLLEFMLFEKKSEGARGKENSFRFPPRRPYVYEYDYGRRGMRRTRSFGDVNETGGREGREEKRAMTPLREMKPERIFRKMGHLQRLLDRFLACRPRGLAKNSRMILIALYSAVKDSFKLYADIREVLAVLLDKCFDMEYPDCVKVFDAYASSANQVDELVDFYNWCKNTGVARLSEYPEVERINSELLKTLEEYLRDRAKRPESPEKNKEPPAVAKEEEAVPDMSEIKEQPPPENYSPPPSPPPPEPEPKPQPQVTEDLVNLRDDVVTADDQGKKLALALFAASPTNNANGEPEVSSAWQTPAAEPGKADWELELAQTASNLSRQKATLGGGFDPLLLNGMYDQALVRQHVKTTTLSGGSESSVVWQRPGRNTSPVLALPAPDGSVQKLNQDPFSASLSFPPPSYVQMADMEKHQQFLVQEQQLWQQYSSQLGQN